MRRTQGRDSRRSYRSQAPCIRNRRRKRARAPGADTTRENGHASGGCGRGGTGVAVEIDRWHRGCWLLSRSKLKGPHPHDVSCVDLQKNEQQQLYYTKSTGEGTIFRAERSTLFSSRSTAAAADPLRLREFCLLDSAQVALLSSLLPTPLPQPHPSAPSPLPTHHGRQNGRGQSLVWQSDGRRRGCGGRVRFPRAHSAEAALHASEGGDNGLQDNSRSQVH